MLRARVTDPFGRFCLPQRSRRALVRPVENRGDGSSRRKNAFLALAVLAVAVNLRPAVVAVGPILTEIGDELELASWALSLLAAVPLLCFGALAPIAPGLGRRYGLEPVLAVVLTLIALALLLRVAGGPALLFAGTAVAAGAVAVANVLVPALVKRDFPARSGLLMGVYITVMAGSAAVAAGLTVPVADVLGGGWRLGLGMWALLAALSLGFWLPQVRRRAPLPVEVVAGGDVRRILRSPLAWQVTTFMGLQSLTVYALLAWLPAVYRDYGWSPSAAGALLSVVLLVQMPGSLLLPVLAARARDQRWAAACTTLLTAAGLSGILVAPIGGAWVWAVLLGLGTGGAFALALTLFVLRGGSSRETAQLSAMAQTFGYLLAAAGPFMFGLLRDVTGGWRTPLVLLLALGGVQLVAGVLSGRPMTLQTIPRRGLALPDAAPRREPICRL